MGEIVDGDCELVMRPIAVRSEMMIKLFLKMLYSVLHTFSKSFVLL